MKTYPGIFRIVVAAFAADNIEPIGTCIAGCDGKIMPAGLYTKTSGVGITGDGALRVRSSTNGNPGVMFIFR